MKEIFFVILTSTTVTKFTNAQKKESINIQLIEEQNL